MAYRYRPFAFDWDVFRERLLGEPSTVPFSRRLSSLKQRSRSFERQQLRNRDGSRDGVCCPLRLSLLPWVGVIGCLLNRTSRLMFWPTAAGFGTDAVSCTSTGIW